MEDVISLCCSAPFYEETDLCSKCLEHSGASAVFELTQEQVTEIHNCNFEPKLTIVGVNNTPQLRAQLVWIRFAREMGFVVDTVQPVGGRTVHFFSAEVAS
jgi:hypothetical protein